MSPAASTTLTTRQRCRLGPSTTTSVPSTGRPARARSRWARRRSWRTSLAWRRGAWAARST
eukprot:9576557-Alexandrium_andersonii.AAC.1